MFQHHSEYFGRHSSVIDGLATFQQRNILHQTSVVIIDHFNAPEKKIDLLSV